MPRFKVKLQFKGDKTYYVTASDDNEAQDKAVELLEWDIPDTTYLEVVKLDRLDDEDDGA
jgi:hypothetical protein